MSFSAIRLDGSARAQPLSFPQHPICVALQGTSAADLIRQATEAQAETHLLEFRLDSLPEPAAALPELQSFLKQNPHLTVIGTCRRQSDGGQFAGSIDEELAVLLQAARSGFAIVDLAIASAQALPPADLASLRATGVTLLLSHHDFDATPELAPILADALRLQPDLVKIVTTATCLSDNLRMLALVEQNRSGVGLIGICMGEAGAPSRILGLRAGSPFTFASASYGSGTAPGQITAGDMLHSYRAPTITANTRLFGVIGDPVRHSLSPRMHNRAFAHTGLDAVYLPLPTADLGDLRAFFDRLPLQGLSVTMPHKEHILSLLDSVDPLARQIGACNTVARMDGNRLHGSNTDVAGITVPLRKRLHSLQSARVLVLGSGGAARAAVFGLRAEGAEVVIHNRSPKRAEELAAEANATTIDRLDIRHARFDVIVNTTPLGMAGHAATSPLEPDELVAPLVFDLIYNPLETPLLAAARKRGLATISGVEMFVHQGARQFELWTGSPAPEHEMRQAVLEALDPPLS